jgi:hypothetical protein
MRADSFYFKCLKVLKNLKALRESVLLMLDRNDLRA